MTHFFAIKQVVLRTKSNSSQDNRLRFCTKYTKYSVAFKIKYPSNAEIRFVTFCNSEETEEEDGERRGEPLRSGARTHQPRQRH